MTCAHVKEFRVIIMEKEYNDLTKRLLAEGYTQDYYPNYVQVCSSRLPGTDVLNNLAGGFEYKRWYIEKLVFKTGCGLYIKGEHTFCMNMGIEWSYENNNPVFICPFFNPKCENNDSRLYGIRGEGTLSPHCFCTCKITQDAYSYDQSIEKIRDDHKRRQEEKYKKFVIEHNGRVCRNQSYYDERTEIWTQQYHPGKCVECNRRDCPVLGKDLDKKKGNVYYDVKITARRYDLDGTLFEGQIDTVVNKGIRYFQHPVSMDICRNYVKLCQEELKSTILLNKYLNDIFFAERYGKFKKIEIINIRAESKESRDLMQDLQDIKDGISIAYDADMRKANKEYKQKRRLENKRKRILSAERKILRLGYDELDDNEKYRFLKLLGDQRITEILEERKRVIEEKKNQPVQLELPLDQMM